MRAPLTFLFFAGMKIEDLDRIDSLPNAFLLSLSTVLHLWKKGNETGQTAALEVNGLAA